MTMAQICRQERTPRSSIARLGGALNDLMAWIRRRRQMRKSTAVLDTLDDRMLADIGLRRIDLAGELSVGLRSHGQTRDYSPVR